MFRLRGLCTSSLLIAAALAAGCGSDDDESASSAKPAAASAAQGADEGFTRALAVYERYKQEPAPLEFPPLGSKPEAGKSVAVLSCPIPACKLTTENVAMAAQQLGWKPKVFVSQFSPESYQKTWDQMLQSDPDFIAAVGLLPSAAVEKQLAEAEKKDIKVVMISPNGDAGEGGEGQRPKPGSAAAGSGSARGGAKKERGQRRRGARHHHPRKPAS